MPVTSYEVESFIRRCHVYKSPWIDIIGQIVVADLETGNVYDRHAVTLKLLGGDWSGPCSQISFKDLSLIH